MKLPIVVGLSFTLSLLASACSSPGEPSGTRIIRLGGDLTFGNVSLANSPVKDAVMTVSNDGNETLQVTGLGGPCANTYLTVPGSKSFAVAPGETVPVTFRFAPRVYVDCSGTVSISANHTSGVDTIPVLARGVAPGCEVVPPQDPIPPFCLGR